MEQVSENGQNPLLLNQCRLNRAETSKCNLSVFIFPFQKMNTNLPGEIRIFFPLDIIGDVSTGVFFEKIGKKLYTFLKCSQ